MAKSLLNSSEYRKESSCVEPWAPRQSNHRMDMGSIENTISWAQFSDGFLDRNGGYQGPRFKSVTFLIFVTCKPTNIKFRNPNESKLESNPDPVYLRFQNIDLGLWMSRRFPAWSLIRSWHNFSVGGTTHRASLLKNTQMGVTEFGLGSCYIILTGPYSVKSVQRGIPKYPNRCLCAILF